MVRHQRPWKVVQEIPCQALHDGPMLQRGKAYTNSNPLTSGSPATLKTIAIPVPKHWSETWLVTWWQPTKQRNSFDVPSLEAVRIILPRAQQIQCVGETIRAQGYGSLAASNSMHIHCISNIQLSFFCWRPISMLRCTLARFTSIWYLLFNKCAAYIKSHAQCICVNKIYNIFSILYTSKF